MIPSYERNFSFGNSKIFAYNDKRCKTVDKCVKGSLHVRSLPTINTNGVRVKLRAIQYL